jgi:hypothetical protein
MTAETRPSATRRGLTPDVSPPDVAVCDRVAGTPLQGAFTTVPSGHAGV